MKTLLEPEDVLSIAEKVVEMLRPLIPTGSQEDALFDKKGLAEYLRVDVSWIDKAITNRTIPYFKMGKYTRFRKSHIDRWLEAKKVEPLPSLELLRRR